MHFFAINTQSDISYHATLKNKVSRYIYEQLPFLTLGKGGIEHLRQNTYFHKGGKIV